MQMQSTTRPAVSPMPFPHGSCFGVYWGVTAQYFIALFCHADLMGLGEDDPSPNLQFMCRNWESRIPKIQRVRLGQWAMSEVPICHSFHRCKLTQMITLGLCLVNQITLLWLDWKQFQKYLLGNTESEWKQFYKCEVPWYLNFCYSNNKHNQCLEKYCIGNNAASAKNFKVSAWALSKPSLNLNWVQPA